MDEVYAEYFQKSVVTSDFFRLMVGDRLGSGIGREVFVMTDDKAKVIKFEAGSHSFQNVMEWETWERLDGTPQAKWLAPCIRISACGTILVMARTEPLPLGFKLPKQVPAFLGDFKRDNYGLLNGKLVCHDYGYTRAIQRGAGKAMCALGKRLSP
jgi:hypothetical protein